MPYLSSILPEFKKIPDSDKPNEFKNLLKCTYDPCPAPRPGLPFHSAYQTEIDNLTKRCKGCENAFLNVYKVLAEAPDPYPLLETAVVCLFLFLPSGAIFKTVLFRTRQ